MADLAEFDSYDAQAVLPAEPLLIVAPKPHQQRVVLYTPNGGWRIASSSGKAAGGSAYQLENQIESFIVGPEQPLYAQPTATPRRLSVFLAPLEDDYFESGGLLCHDAEDPMGGF